MKTKKTRIGFDYQGKHYTLEFTAQSLKAMEEGGFDFTTIDSKIMTGPENVFIGAFIANHADTPIEKRLEIYQQLKDEKIGQSSMLYTTLLAMIGEAYDELTTHLGNIAWSVEA